MSTTSTEVALPHTGELVDLADIAACAAKIEELRVLEARIKNVKHELSQAVGAYTLVYGAKTMRLAGASRPIKVSGGPEGGEIQWDLDVLEGLLTAGLPGDRYDQLVTEVVTHKVDARLAVQLEKANPEYAAVIRRARSRADKPWSVSL